MAQNLRYLDRFKDIIHSLAVKFNVTDEVVVDVIDHFFQTLKRFITDIRMPTIKITKWGTFKPTIGKINWQIGTTLHFMNEERGDREKMFKKIRIIQAVKDRLLREKAKEHTWKEWRKKKPEELENLPNDQTEIQGEKG